MKAKEIMTRDPHVVTPSDDLRRAAELMRDTNVGIVPVVDDPNSMQLRGVVTDRDITVRHVAEGHGAGCRVSEAMSDRDLVTASPDDDMDVVTDRMRAAQVRRIPVVESGRLVGIIAQADVATRYGEETEVARTVEEVSKPGGPRR